MEKSRTVNYRGWPLGESHGRAKLSEEQVRRARLEYHHGVRGFGKAALAKRYGVALATMRDVLNWATWPHVR